jgi:hypothetical protein
MRRRAALAVLVLALGGVVALPAAPASACAGEACDGINRICRKLGGSNCVGWSVAG